MTFDPAPSYADVAGLSLPQATPAPTTPPPTVNPANQSSDSLFGIVTALAADATQIAVANKSTPSTGLSTGKPSATVTPNATTEIIAGVSNQTLLVGGLAFALVVLVAIRARK